MAGEPKFDENVLLERLSQPIAVTTASDMRHAAATVLIDAWDRDMIRKPFVDLVCDVLPLNDNLARLEVLMGVLAVFHAGMLTEDNLQDSIRKIAASADSHRKDVKAALTLLQECAYDPIEIN